MIYFLKVCCDNSSYDCVEVFSNKLFAYNRYNQLRLRIVDNVSMIQTVYLITEDGEVIACCSKE